MKALLTPRFHIISLSILFILICALNKYTIVLYPAIMVFLVLLNTEYAFDFMILTMGINYLFFTENSSIFMFHPNSFITAGQIIFLIIALIKQRNKLQIYPEAFTLFGFLILSIITLFFSKDSTNGINILFSFILYLLALIYFSNSRNLTKERLFQGLVLSFFIICLIVVPLQYFFNSESLFQYNPERGYRLTIGAVHPVPLSFFFAMVFFASLFLLESSKRIFHMVSLVFSFIGIILTNTRTALIGVIVLTGYYLIVKKKYWILLLSMIAGPMVLFQKIMSIIFKTNIEASQDLTYITSGRIDFWTLMLHEFIKNPILGAGLGSSSAIMSTFNLITPHNDFIRILFELGILGLLIFIIFLIEIFKYTFKYRKKNPLILCIFLFFIITLFFDNTIDYNLYFTLYVFILMGMIKYETLNARNPG